MFEKFLKTNLNLKVLSIVLAVCLWFAVRFTQSATAVGGREEGLKVSLVVENLAPGMEVLEAPREVFLAVKENARNAGEPKSSDFKAYVDLEGRKEGVFRDLPVHIAAPMGYEVSVVKPDHVEVVLDEESEKTVPILWESSGKEVQEKVVLTPPELVVRGSKSLVEQVTAAQVKIPGFAGDFSGMRELTPIPVNRLSRPVVGVQVIPQTVTASIESSQLLKPVSISPVLVGSMGKDMEVESVSVSPPVLLVEQSVSGKVTHLDTLPIQISGKVGRMVVRTRILSPPGIKISGSDEVTVTVIISKKRG